MLWQSEETSIDIENKPLKIIIVLIVDPSPPKHTLHTSRLLIIISQLPGERIKSNIYLTHLGKD